MGDGGTISLPYRCLCASGGQVLQLADRLIKCSHRLFGFIPVHECLKESACGSWGWNCCPPSFLLEQPDCFGHLIRGPRGPEIGFGKLILAFIERASESIEFR